MNKDDFKIIIMGIILIGSIFSGVIFYMIEQNRPEVSYYAIALAIILSLNQIYINRKSNVLKTKNKKKN